MRPVLVSDRTSTGHPW